MSWLTDARDAIPGNSFVQNPNIGQLDNSVQNLNIEHQAPSVQNPNAGSWLLDIKNEVDSQVDTTSLIDKGKELAHRIVDPVIQGVKDEESKFNQMAMGVNDAIGTLAWGALTYMPSLAMGGSRMAYEKIKNLGAEYPLSAKAISRKVKRDAAILPGLLPPPRNKEGEAIVAPVEKAIHWLTTVPRKIGKDMEEFYGLI